LITGWQSKPVHPTKEKAPEKACTISLLERTEDLTCGMKGAASDEISHNRCGHLPAMVVSYVPGMGTVCLKMLKQYSIDMACLGFKSMNSTPIPLSDVWATLDFTCMADFSEGNFMIR
jgi:hypothetical protein